CFSRPRTGAVLGKIWPSLRTSGAHAEIAQHLVQGRLTIGGGGARANDQRAADLVLAGGITLRAGTRHDYRAGGHAAVIGDRRTAAHVDDRRAGGDGHVGAQHGTLFDDHTFGDDAARTNKGAIFDDNWPRPWRLEDAADDHTPRQVHVAPDLRPAAH